MENLINERMDSLIYTNTVYSKPVDTLSYHTKTMNYEDVIEFYHKFYTPENMVLSIVSHIPFSTIKHIIETSYFMKKQNSIYREIPVYIEPQSELKCNIYKKSNLSASHLSISFRTCPYDNDDRYLLYLLSQIIGATFSSRLFSILREENGLTYSSNSDVTFYKYSGHLSIDLTLDPKKVIKNGDKKGVLPLIIDLLNDLYKNGISMNEFELIKGYIKGQFVIKLEDSLNQCEYNGKTLLLYDTKFTAYDKLFKQHYSKMKKNEINNIIKKYLKKTNMSVCLLGSYVPSLDILKKECLKFIG
jgi:zinc protease